MTDTSATAFFRQAAEQHSGPFFHGTAHEFQPGDYVDPSYELGGRKGKSHAFMTSDAGVAHNYGKHKAWTRSMYENKDFPGRAYEVKPTGPIEADDTVDDRFKAWRTRHPLQVVREVHPDEIGHTAGLTRQANEHGWHQHPDSPHIVRGIVAQPDEGIHRDVAHRLMTGTADHHDVLGLIDTHRAGKYWYTHGPGPGDSLPDSKTYAHEGEHLTRWHGHAEPEDTHISGAVGVAMVGHRPKGWNPDDNHDDGLMGNSHLPDNSHIRLHELHYSPDGGDTWHQAPVPHGTMVHTDGPPKTATAFFHQAVLAEAAAIDNSSGVMVAFSPPQEIAEQLARKDGQPAHDLHVTLAYLGKTSDYTKEQLLLLPRLVSSWAVRQKPVNIRTGGVGKFSREADDQHVLWASIDIPGGAQLHSDLARYLEGHGFRLPSEHGWSPHMTLQYVDRHFRFMPHLPEHRWTATEVETHIGGTCHKARLGHLPAGRIAP
ncbi:2'-5' RNA ligase family protein [Streptomyces griseus]